ncbi:hypothetical protein CDAR_127851 [Caerostris darwini]|uniref:Uncharacterized protein n=1 Tax=Caerostris darwini TaxID=1538125 RepID=A0AAV4R0J4_9ARAC|nr:hypothetical protein CDAR_127851 [Caerostris darwini]
MHNSRHKIGHVQHYNKVCWDIRGGKSAPNCGGFPNGLHPVKITVFGVKLPLSSLARNFFLWDVSQGNLLEEGVGWRVRIIPGIYIRNIFPLQWVPRMRRGNRIVERNEFVVYY